MRKTIEPRKIIIRITTVVLLLCLSLTALVSCGGNRATELTPEHIYDESLEEGCSLSAKQLNELADTLGQANGKTVKVKNADGADVQIALDVRSMLIAAYRGYNMLDPAFDDAKLTENGANVPAPQKADADVAAAKTLIAKAAEATGTALTVDYQSLNAPDMLTLINSFRVKVDMENDKGVIDTILGWVGAFLGWLTNTVGFGSYILGIFIFAVIVEILMLPFAIKQQKNSIKQAKLRPKEMAIRKKYQGRDDQATRQKVTQEIQELYQKENFNQFAGCLPLLLQLPILLGLYQVVVNPLQHVLGQAESISAALTTFAGTARAAGGLGMSVASGNSGTIGLLSQLRESLTVLDGLKDFAFFSNGSAVFDSISKIAGDIPNFMLGSLNLGETPSFGGTKLLLLVPLLTFVAYFGSMRLTRKFTYQPTITEGDKQAACSNTMMDITMPLMSVYIAFIVPALVGVYWIFKSVISTLRQFIMTKVMPYPKFTEEDYRAAEREYAGKAPSRRSTPQNYNYGNRKMVGGKPKSLFHMDDDDYVAKIEEEEKREQEEAAAKEAEASSRGVSQAELKDDARDKRSKKK